MEDLWPSNLPTVSEEEANRINEITKLRKEKRQKACDTTQRLKEALQKNDYVVTEVASYDPDVPGLRITFASEDQKNRFIQNADLTIVGEETPHRYYMVDVPLFFEVKVKATTNAMFVVGRQNGDDPYPSYSWMTHDGIATELTDNVRIFACEKDAWYALQRNTALIMLGGYHPMPLSKAIKYHTGAKVEERLFRGANND